VPSRYMLSGALECLRRRMLYSSYSHLQLQCLMELIGLVDWSRA